MELIKRYFIRLGIWSAALFAFLFLAGSGSEIWSTASRLPALACFAMILACFPAGLSIGAGVLENPATFLREGLKLSLFYRIYMNAIVKLSGP